MPILREDDPRIGCLALPVSGLAGFVLFALMLAAVGADAETATIGGVVGVLVGFVFAALVLRGRD